MPRIMLLGPPGSGKGTLATKIIQVYMIPTIATGDELRHQVATSTDIGKRAEAYMKEGKLVPDEIILELVELVFEKNDLSNGFLLDGFPRTIVQAEELEEYFSQTDNHLDKVFYLRVSKDVLVKRLANRRVCPNCGATYNMSGKKAKVAGLCNKCGTKLIKREDDRPHVVKKRLDIYNEQTNPLVDYYKEKGILMEIDGGSEDIDAKIGQIMDALKAT